MNGGGANDFEHIMMRKYLFAYETVPARMLKVYGLATFPDLSDEAVWGRMKQLLKSGCPYMTEYCSGESEWQSIGFNCFAVSMLRCGSIYSVGQATNMKDNGSIVGLTRATNLESVCL